MNFNQRCVALLFSAVFVVATVKAGSLVVLDGAYTADWEIENDVITVNISVKATGYIGFGINSASSMTGADLFVGGVYPNGTTYGLDLHGVGNTYPVIDDQQDYELLSATEVGSETFVSFRRPLSSLDSDNDLSIANEPVYYLWSIGSSDQLEYHSFARGSVELNFFDE